ncbi:MAG: YraN family protein [Planctomycetaceae bacterium]|nr:YraN family protein [Planctomycetaceae bacterium]
MLGKFLTRWLGNRGERKAARFLRRQGFRILARQYANRHGEIDLIARDGDFIVFVEVKTRRSDAAGLPVEAVTTDKQRKLTKTALVWLKRRGLLESRCRFDVVSIVWPEDSKTPQITHYKNAFPATGVSGMYS